LKDTEIAQILMEQNEQYKKLSTDHKGLEQILADIDKNKYLSPEQEMERKTVQKQKLRKKDNMAELIREYRKKLEG
jgi:uncharacterized protein YdcH (DUF465 family)